MEELTIKARGCGKCGALVGEGNVCGSPKCHPKERIEELEEKLTQAQGLADHRLEGCEDMTLKYAEEALNLTQAHKAIRRQQKQVSDLMAESYGVTGLHLDGKTAQWDWLLEEWLSEFDGQEKQELCECMGDSKVEEPLEESLTFNHQLRNLINKNSMENGSDTPDFLLADFMYSCLVGFDHAVKMRTKWYQPTVNEPEGEVEIQGWKWCEGCTGTGRVGLPQKIISPGVEDLVLRTKECDQCHGSGKVAVPKEH